MDALECIERILAYVLLWDGHLESSLGIAFLGMLSVHAGMSVAHNIWNFSLLVLVCILHSTSKENSKSKPEQPATNIPTVEKPRDATQLTKC